MPARELAAALGYGPAAAGGHDPLSFAQGAALAARPAVARELGVQHRRGRAAERAGSEPRILRAALTEVTRRHAVLRTPFGERTAASGNGLRRRPSCRCRSSTLAGLPDAAATGGPPPGRRRDAAGLRSAPRPLLRVRLLRLAPAEHAALLTLHHIAGDGWSMGVLVREVGALYAAFAAGLPSPPLLPLPLQYARHRPPAAPDARRRRSRGTARLLAAAARRGAEEIGLPFDHPAPRGSPRAPGEERARCACAGGLGGGAGLARRHRLHGAARRLEGPPAPAERQLGQSSSVRRSRTATAAEIEGLIGFFVNTLVLRTDLAGGRLGFRELVERVRETAVGPSRTRTCRSSGWSKRSLRSAAWRGRPCFQVMFALQNAPFEELALPGLTLAPLAAENRTAKFDLSFLLAEAGDEISGSLTFSRDLFEPGDRRAVAACLGALLAGAAGRSRRAGRRAALDEPRRAGRGLAGVERRAGTRGARRCLHAVRPPGGTLAAGRGPAATARRPSPIASWPAAWQPWGGPCAATAWSRRRWPACWCAALPRR